MLSVRMVMDEETYSEVFPDCERGVIPPCGELYGFPALGGELCSVGEKP